MAWRDLGLIYAVDRRRHWMVTHGYVPTALPLGDRIRLYTAFWDDASQGRVGFVDVAADDPATVLDVGAEPCLDLGQSGRFDEHGVTPMSVERHDGQVWLFYAGWQRCQNTRYLLFTGLATSRDGVRFERAAANPILGPTPDHCLVRTGFIFRDHGGWRGLIAQSTGLDDISGKPTPRYRLDMLCSADGMIWPEAGRCCFETTDDIFGYGRSAVWRGIDGRYHGLFSIRRRSVGYQIEYSTSPDGFDWEPLRRDGLALLPEHTAPRQQETCFPSVVAVGERLFAFYNGDNFGRAGIRCAIWDGPVA